MVLLCCSVPATLAEKKSSKPLIKFSNDEAKAVRVEMIEMDITIRSIASMISLNNTERLAVLFDRLTEFKTLSSPYYKSGINGAIRKWKAKNLYSYLDEIRKTSQKAVKTLAEEKNNDPMNIQWKVIYDYNQKILENCRLCHSESGVDAGKL